MSVGRAELGSEPWLYDSLTFSPRLRLLGSKPFTSSATPGPSELGRPRFCNAEGAANS